MSMFESALLALLVSYSFWFLVRPHPALRQRSLRQPEGQVQITVPAPSAADGYQAQAPLPAPTQKALDAPSTETPPPPLAERLLHGLARTRAQLWGTLGTLFTSSAVLEQRERVLEQLFEALIRCDTGVATSERLVKGVKAQLAGHEQATEGRMRDALKASVRDVLRAPVRSSSARLVRWLSPSSSGAAHDASNLHVVLVVGVNGVGKTTTTGKLAHRLGAEGFHVVIGAADTFRAAAVEQLRVWAQRAQADFVTHESESAGDPAAVAFEAVKKAAAHAQNHPSGRGTVCLVDTAGRLHNRKDLMEELAKVRRVMGKHCPDAPHEVLLVVDATTGQNALQQARLFREAVDVTGVILTKLDGTAKGGVAMALAAEHGLPIDFVGVGEGLGDLQVFDADGFVDALFASDAKG